MDQGTELLAEALYNRYRSYRSSFFEGFENHLGLPVSEGAGRLALFFYFFCWKMSSCDHKDAPKLNLKYSVQHLSITEKTVIENTRRQCRYIL